MLDIPDLRPLFFAVGIACFILGFIVAAYIIPHIHFHLGWH